MNPDTPITTSPTNPGAFRYILGFLLVGAAWGLTTPFMRKAARSAPSSTAPDSRQWLEEVRDTDDEEEKSFVGKGLGKIKAAGWWVKRFVWGRVYAVVDLLKRPAYAVPLLINVTGSVWFFLLVGQSELSLTVPITNSLAFLFTVLGDYWAEGKMIQKDTWLGMAFVLGGIALCVHSKSSA